MSSTKDEDRGRAEAVAEAKGRDEPAGGLRDLKDAAEARGLLTGESGQTVRRPPYAEESAERQKLEEMRLRGSGQHEEAQR